MERSVPNLLLMLEVYTIAFMAPVGETIWQILLGLFTPFRRSEPMQQIGTVESEMQLSRVRLAERTFFSLVLLNIHIHQLSA